MPVRLEIRELKALARLPDDSRDDIPDDLLERFEELLARVMPPVRREEADILVKLFADTSAFGLEWTLVHLLETTEGWPIEETIRLCPSKHWQSVLGSRTSS